METPEEELLRLRRDLHNCQESLKMALDTVVDLQRALKEAQDVLDALDDGRYDV